MVRKVCGFTKAGSYEHRAGCAERHPALVRNRVPKTLVVNVVGLKAEPILTAHTTENPAVRPARFHPDPAMADNLHGAYKMRGGLCPPDKGSVAVRAAGSMPQRPNRVSRDGMHKPGKASPHDALVGLKVVGGRCFVCGVFRGNPHAPLAADVRPPRPKFDRRPVRSIKRVAITDDSVTYEVKDKGRVKPLLVKVRLFW